MSIVNQYKPQVPRTSNALHQLTLRRQQARREADEAWHDVQHEFTNVLNPTISSEGILTSITHTVPMLIKGVVAGCKFIGRFIGKGRKTT